MSYLCYIRDGAHHFDGFGVIASGAGGLCIDCTICMSSRGRVGANDFRGLDGSKGSEEGIELVKAVGEPCVWVRRLSGGHGNLRERCLMMISMRMLVASVSSLLHSSGNASIGSAASELD